MVLGSNMLHNLRSKIWRLFFIPALTICSAAAAQTGPTQVADEDELDAYLDERMIVFEGEVWGGDNSRSGNAINSSGPPRTEIEDFPLLGGGFLAAFPILENGLVQFEFNAERSFFEDEVAGRPAQDTYSVGYAAGGHLAYTSGPFLFGAFAGLGRSLNSQDSQNSRNMFGGIEARFISEIGALAVQGGYLNTIEDDAETITDAVIARVLGHLFLDGGKTVLSADFSYAEGVSDVDRSAATGRFDPTRVIAWGAEAERQVNLGIENANTSIFVAYQGIRVREQPSLPVNVARPRNYYGSCNYGWSTLQVW